MLLKRLHPPVTTVSPPDGIALSYPSSTTTSLHPVAGHKLLPFPMKIPCAMKLALLLIGLLSAVGSAMPLGQTPPTTSIVAPHPYTQTIDALVDASPTPEEAMLMESPMASPDDAAEQPMFTPEVTSTTPEAITSTPPSLRVPRSLPPAQRPPVGTNEFNYDQSPVDGRAFPPAACDCLADDDACPPVIAAASGVCRPGLKAHLQSSDCHFACCRFCQFASRVSWCSDEQVIRVCASS